MLKSGLENLRSRPHNHRVSAAFVITGLFALVLVPVWVWNAGQTTGFHSLAGKEKKSEEVASTASAADVFPDQIPDIPNPINEIDGGLQKTFAEPIKVVTAGMADGRFVVHFRVENSTFAQLTSPFSQSYVVAKNNPSGIFVPEKVTTPDGGQMIPGVLPGQKKEGLLSFPVLVPGEYHLKFPAMQYEGEDQTTFMQTIDITVGNSQLPRS